MSVKIPKRLIRAAVKFHGHLGPFLILGLKAGIFANEVLGKDCFKTRTIVETELTPPCLCFVDGIQIATGCTMGKGNVELKKGSSLSVTFLKDDKKLTLNLRNEILENLLNLCSEGETEKTASGLSQKPTQELFDVKG